MSTNVRVFLQARMDSTRFPGKVLAPLAGTPILERVIDAINPAVSEEQFVLLTSTEPTDDPLAAYAEDLGIEVFRGHLTNVIKRYRSALAEYPCEYVFRVCCDSPFLEPALFEQALAVARSDDADLITTKGDGSLPLGKNVELLSTDTFLDLPLSELDDDECEHITLHYYDNPDDFHIHRLETPEWTVDHDGFCVDTLDDLRRLEADVSNDRIEVRKFGTRFEE